MQYYLYRLAQIIASYLPRPFAYWVGLRLSECFYLFKPASRRGIIANLRHVFACEGQVFADHELRVLARESFHNFGKHVVEFFRFHRLTNDQIKSMVTVRDGKKLDDLLQHGRGLIVVTAHFGSWEMGGGTLAAHGYRTSVVALVQPGAKLNALFQRQRMARGLNVIPMGNAARACLEALRRNEIVALAGDRDFTANRSTVDFFDKPARLPHGPVRLAQVSGAPILPAFMVRNPGDTFCLFFGDPIWVKKRNPVAMQEGLDAVARQLEWAIRQYPTQWFIFNDFWDLQEDVEAQRRAFQAGVQTLRENQPH